MEFDNIFKEVDNNGIRTNTAVSGNIVDLYNLIDNYVEKNYISTFEWENYHIKYNGKYYLVGYFHGQEIVYYVRKSKYVEGIEYLDLNNVLNNIITPKEEDIKNRIDIIKEEIDYLQKEGVKTATLKRALRI